MNKRIYVLQLALLWIGAGLISPYFVGPGQPRYEGKVLSYWLERMHDAETAGKSQEAVRQAGTAALPLLLTCIKAEDSRWKVELADLLEWRCLRWRFALAGDLHARAIRAFAVLGPQATPAIPELVQALNHGPTAQAAALSLAAIGPEGICALTKALGNPDKTVQAAILTTLRRYADLRRDDQPPANVRVSLPPLLGKEERAQGQEVSFPGSHGGVNATGALPENYSWKSLYDPH